MRPALHLVDKSAIAASGPSATRKSCAKDFPDPHGSPSMQMLVLCVFILAFYLVLGIVAWFWR